MPDESVEEGLGGVGGTGSAFPSLESSVPTPEELTILHHTEEDVKQADELKEESQEEARRVSVRKGSRKGMWEEWPWRKYGRGRAQLRWVLRLEWEVLKREWGWLLLGLCSVYMGAVASNAAHVLTASQPAASLPHGPLPDVLHSLLGHWPNAVLPLYPLCVALLCTTGFALLPLAQVFFSMPPHIYPPVQQWMGLKGHDSIGYVLTLPVPCVLLWRRLSQALAIAHSTRAAAILLTLVPSVSPSCRHLPSLPSSPSSLATMLLDPVHALGCVPACSSLLVSSSALHSFLALCLTTSSFPHLPWPLHALLWAMGGAVVVLCLGLRACYSSGVLLGLYVAGTAWALSPAPSPHMLEDKYGLRLDVWLRDDTDRARARAQVDMGEAGRKQRGAYVYLPSLAAWDPPFHDATQAQTARLSLPW